MDKQCKQRKSIGKVTPRELTSDFIDETDEKAFDEIRFEGERYLEVGRYKIRWVTRYYRSRQRRWLYRISFTLAGVAIGALVWLVKHYGG